MACSGLQLGKCLLAIILLLVNVSHGAEDAATRSLFSAINARLNYMPDVALFKAQNQIPIEDIERESIVLASSKELAVEQGLDAQSMEQFFIAQINAAKAIQYRYRAQLLTQGLPNSSVDLNTEIRPALDSLGREIVGLFALFLRTGNSLAEDDREAFRTLLRSPYLTTADEDALFTAMRQVRIAPQLDSNAY